MSDGWPVRGCDRWVLNSEHEAHDYNDRGGRYRCLGWTNPSLPAADPAPAGPVASETTPPRWTAEVGPWGSDFIVRIKSDLLAHPLYFTTQIEAESLAAQINAAPVASSPDRPDLAQIKSDAAWMARCARSSSWPGEMAQRIEDAADRVIAWADRLDESWVCRAMAGVRRCDGPFVSLKHLHAECGPAPLLSDGDNQQAAPT